MTDDRLEYRHTMDTRQKCALCQKPSHYYLIEFRDGWCCLECKRRLRTRWKLTTAPDAQMGLEL